MTGERDEEDEEDEEGQERPPIRYGRRIQRFMAFLHEASQEATVESPKRPYVRQPGRHLVFRRAGWLECAGCQRTVVQGEICPCNNK